MIRGREERALAQRTDTGWILANGICLGAPFLVGGLAVCVLIGLGK